MNLKIILFLTIVAAGVAEDSKKYFGQQCAQRFLRHVGGKMGHRTWIIENWSLFTEEFFDDDLGSYLQKFYKMLRDHRDELWDSKKEFCQLYQQAYLPCMKQMSQKHATEQYQPILLQFTKFLCIKDKRFPVEEHGACLLGAWTKGDSCVQKCHKEIDALKEFKIVELLTADWKFYTLHGHSFLEKTCRLSSCFSNCQVDFEEDCRNNDLEKKMLKRVLQYWLNRAKKSILDNVGSIVTYVFWPTVCDQFIEGKKLDAEEDKGEL